MARLNFNNFAPAAALNRESWWGRCLNRGGGRWRFKEGEMEIDHDGRMVTIAEYNLLVNRIKVLEELLKEAMYILRHDKYIRIADSISAAMEVKP
jgi:hypothetical protein